MGLISALRLQQEHTTMIDELVPDPQVRKELGGISDMTTWRWDRDPKMAALGWPPVERIRSRKFRSRKLLEQFKANLFRQALEARERKVGI
jgi:hypothetical protein